MVMKMNNTKIMTIYLKDGQHFTVNIDDWTRDCAKQLVETLNLSDTSKAFRALISIDDGLLVRSEDIKYIYVEENEL